MSSQLPVPVLEQQSPALRLFGYARVSTGDQDLSLQIAALQQHGIPKTAIFMDKVSGAKNAATRQVRKAPTKVSILPYLISRTPNAAFVRWACFGRFFGQDDTTQRMSLV